MVCKEDKTMYGLYYIHFSVVNDIETIINLHSLVKN